MRTWPLLALALLPGCGTVRSLLGLDAAEAPAPPDEMRCDRNMASVECYQFVPETTFLMGAQATDPAAPGYDPDAQPDEAPPHTVTVSGFWIQRHETDIAAFDRCVGAGACSKSDAITDGPLATLGQTEDFDMPVVGVTWEAAMATCVHQGGRLPTEAEWEAAARGTDGRRFPWGDTPACGVGDRDGQGRWTHEMSETTRCQLDGPLVPAHLRGESPYGIVGMAGNVWEWVADWYAPDAYAQHASRDPTGPSEGTLRVQRGGGWSEHEPTALRSAGRQAMPPSVKLHDVGFRCVWTGEPVTP